MKHITYTVGAESFRQQMHTARAMISKLSEIAIECGATWDGADGFTFTDEQHARYAERLREEGLL